MSYPVVSEKRQQELLAVRQRQTEEDPSDD
jgi:hypothetical protein